MNFAIKLTIQKSNQNREALSYFWVKKRTKHLYQLNISRVAEDMDIHGYTHGYIHGYIHVWISDLGHTVDISMHTNFYLIRISDINFEQVIFSVNRHCQCSIIFRPTTSWTGTLYLVQQKDDAQLHQAFTIYRYKKNRNFPMNLWQTPSTSKTKKFTGCTIGLHSYGRLSGHFKVCPVTLDTKSSHWEINRRSHTSHTVVLRDAQYVRHLVVRRATRTRHHTAPFIKRAPPADCDRSRYSLWCRSTGVGPSQPWGVDALPLVPWRTSMTRCYVTGHAFQSFYVAMEACFEWWDSDSICINSRHAHAIIMSVGNFIL